MGGRRRADAKSSRVVEGVQSTMEQVSPKVRVATRQSSVVRRDREAEGVVIMPCSREMRQRRRASSRSDRWRIFETMGEVVEAMVGAMKSSWRSEGASMPAQ